MRSVRSALNEKVKAVYVATGVVLALTLASSAAPLYFLRYRPLFWISIIFSLVAALVSLKIFQRRITCPSCGTDLRPLVCATRPGQSLRIAMRLAPDTFECPHCSVSFDHSRAPERNDDDRVLPNPLKLMGAAVLFPLLSTAAIAVTYGEPVITIINAGTTPVSAVHARGLGFDVDLGTIRPGESVSAAVTARGSTPLELFWTSNGQRFNRDALGELQRFGGICAKIEVNGESATAQLNDGKFPRPCPSLRRIF